MAIVGLGTAGRRAAEEMKESRHCGLVAVCDVDRGALRTIGDRYGVRKYDSPAAAISAADVEAVYVATPTATHREVAVAAALAKKHCMLEKPLAASWAEAEDIVAAGRTHQVHIAAVGARGRDAPIEAMAEAVHDGVIGRVINVVNVCYTDWTLRPRFDYEFDQTTGGGVVLRQAPHQVEIVRSILPAHPVGVSATVSGVPSSAGVAGCYSVLLDFADDSCASLIYNGFGYFNSAELTWGVGHSGRPVPLDASLPMRSVRSWALEKYSPEGIGIRHRTTAGAESRRGWGFFGLTLVSGSRGDIRQSRGGLLLYDDNGVREIPVGDYHSSGLARDFEELYGAVRRGIPLVHDAEWGGTTIRICEMIAEAARQRARLRLP